MNAYCPECETELDQATGICPACRWDPTVIALLNQSAQGESELSLTERYRGTRFEASPQQAAMSGNGSAARGRAFVVAALVAGVVLYAIVMSAMGVF